MIQITARELIRRALTLIGVLGQGENPTDQEANDAFLTLNEIVDKWNTENLMIPFNVNTVIPLTGKQMYTIGPTGDIITNRPVAGIDGAYLDYNMTNPGSVSMPVTIFTQQQYNNIPTKQIESNFVRYVYYNGTFPNSEIWVYPLGNEGRLILQSNGLLSIFDNLDTIISLPPGYIKALRYTLAVELSFEYQKPADDNLTNMAVGAKQTIKVNNSSQKLEILGCDNAMIQRRIFNIYSGA